MANQQALIKHAVLFGAVMSLCTVLLTLITYKVSLAALVTVKFALFGFLVGATITAIAGLNFRKKEGGYLSYGRAWLYCFTVMAVAGLFSTIFNEIYYNIVNRGFAEEFTNALADNMEGILRLVNSPDDAIDEALEEVRIETPKQFTPGGLVFGYVKGLIVYAIISLLIAIIVKKNKPENVELKTT
ncbi:MAG TPA: DUF4199 domain-containing protein [Cyclobacteriaceae bacterium]|nr:DUF4199 domain-containing protein [Cyclobacteriaceae bacterium]